MRQSHFPSDYKIAQYVQELVILMLNGCLKSVKYGFKRNGFWVLFVEYKAQFGNIRSVDDNSGRIYSGANTNGAAWTSYLSASYLHLPRPSQDQIKQSLPFLRNSGVEPRLGSGKLSSDKFYSSGSGAFQRYNYY